MADVSTLNSWLVRASANPETGLRLLDRREDASWLSWSEVREQAQRVAGGLRAAGVKRGDRVAVVYPTGAGFFDAFFGVLLAGGVPVPLYPPVRLGRLDEYLHRTAAMLTAVGARLVLADRRVSRLIGEAVEAAAPDLGCVDNAGLDDAGPVEVEVSEDGLAMVQFSSGTTVDPKPVALSHRAVMAQVVRLNRFWPDGKGTVHSGASWLPLYHDMGLIGCVFPALERPAVLTLLPPELFVARPAAWLRAISRYRATVSPAPNFAYGLCVQRIRDDELSGVDLSSWRVALNGAEPVAPRVLREFQQRFSRWGFRRDALTPVYGLSEAALAVTFSAVDRQYSSRIFDPRDLTGRSRAVEAPQGVEMVSLGHPLDGFELRILDRRGSELSEGHVGRLMVRGPSLMEGYLNQAEATSRVMKNGWLDTGDLGFVLDGELYLTGRAKDVLILRGRNHSPVEVEHAVEKVEGVRTGCTAAVSYMPEDGETERLVVLVEARKRVPARDYPVMALAATRAVRAATGLDASHVDVLSPGTLPRTSSGKIRRGEALRQWRAGELRPPDRITPVRIAAAMLRSSTAEARARKARDRS